MFIQKKGEVKPVMILSFTLEFEGIFHSGENKTKQNKSKQKQTNKQKKQPSDTLKFREVVL